MGLRLHATDEAQDGGEDCFSRELSPRLLELAQAAVAGAHWLGGWSATRPGVMLSCHVNLGAREAMGGTPHGLLVAMRTEPPLLRVLGVGLAATSSGSIRLFCLPEGARQLELEHDLDLRLLLGRTLDQNPLTRGEHLAAAPPPVSGSEAATQAEPPPDEDSGPLGKRSA
ncbi:hypothetical protein FJ251_16055 [bacterium]|nr:hypothetical protein [bacterium]